MTREEAIEQLKWYFEYDNGLSADKETVEAYKMAIKALEQEPCEDAISRQAVLDIAKSSKSNWIDNSVLFKRVNELPPVTPQPKTGRWTADKKCSRCGCSSMLKLCIENYCANCGAKMVKSQAESEE